MKSYGKSFQTKASVKQYEAYYMKITLWRKVNQVEWCPSFSRAVRWY